MPECACQQCIGCCNNIPGWFMPGEAEKAAELLKMPFEAFFKDFLIADFWTGTPDIEVLAPVVAESPERGGRRASFGYAYRPGRCVFLTGGGRCRIHAAKPWECAQAMACEAHGGRNRREEISQAWDTPGHQEAITRLLSPKPEESNQ